MRESLLGAFWLTALGLISYACTWNLSSKAERVLKMAGENRPQLEKVLAHYRQNESDSLKLKAAHFLIENMDGHFSYDSTLLQEYRPMLVVYDSLIRYRKAHPQLNLIEHMDSLWSLFLQSHHIYTDIYARPVKEDIKSISADFLIHHIDQAFDAWQNNPFHDGVAFSDFCDYILPYRKFQGLCLEEWRSGFYNDNFDLLRSDGLLIREFAESLLSRYVDYSHTYQIMSDYPYLKSTDFKISKRGGCGEKCWFNSMLFASLGIPVAIDFVPAWGNRNDKHQWNTLIHDGKSYPFESFWEKDKWKYKKLYNNRSSDPLYGDFRLAKVYRYSYRTHGEGPVSDPRVSVADIPPLFLNTKKTDVSDEYFKTCNVEVFLNNKPAGTRYAYLCVFDADRIVPVQWSKITEGNKAVFKKMGMDIVYVAAYCRDGNLLSAGEAFYLNEEGYKEYFHQDQSVKTIVLKRKYPVFPVKAEWAKTLKGGKFQGANNPGFNDADNLHVITETPDFIPTVAGISITRKYRFARFLFDKGKYGNLAEIKFYTSDGDSTKVLKGRQIQAGKLLPEVMQRGMDGNLSTFILPYMPGLISTYEDQWWVGLDFGIQKRITAIEFCPRTDENNIFPGLNYELKYWNNGWISLGVQNARGNELVYENVPDNALFILKCLDKGKEERVFTIKNSKQRWH